MSSITFSGPVNSLSFGFVSYNILLELFKKGVKTNFFPIGGNLDLTSFDKAPEDFKEWLKQSVFYASKDYSKNDPELRQWHIQGSESSIGYDQYLFTFHELSELTPYEVNILNNQKGVFVSSKYSKKVFEDCGVTSPIHYVPLGLDTTHVYRNDKKYYTDGRIVFSVMGKFENRKRHAKLIQAWVSKYGNDRRYTLHLHTYNSFLNPEQNQQILLQVLGGKIPYNVVPQPYVPNLSALNDGLNVCDIILDMSGAEGFSLLSAHCLSIGKHGVIHNATAMKDWSTNDNAVLVEPKRKIDAYDGMFFKQGEKYGQGQIYDWDEDDFLSACDVAIERFRLNPRNVEGEKLRDIYTWDKSVDTILDVMCV